MRITPAMPLAGFRWPELAHDSVRAHAVERARHEAFIRAKLGVGVLALACLPLCLAWRGAPGAIDTVLAVSLAAPVFAAALASLTGRLAAAQAISWAGWAGLFVCVGASLGTGASPAVVAMVFIALAALAEAGAQIWRDRLQGSGAAALPAGQALEEHPVVLAIGDLVTWHDRAGGVVTASASAARFLGAPVASLRGHGLIQHVHVSDRPAFLRALSDAANAGTATCVEFRLHAAAEEPHAAGEGRRRVTWVEMRCRPVPTADTPERGAIAVVGVIRDVSASRRHAEELEAARLEAERANELKGRFLATVTHELRTPLNAIIGFSELLAADHAFVVTDERRKEYAGIIRNSGHHLLEVVNTLLDMSKIETGNFTVDPETFSLAELSDGCCDLMQIRADQAGVTLKRAIARDLPEITADRRACRQILINLLSNAVKFTPAEGSVTVAVRRERDGILLAVSDTGIGVGEQDLARLGDPFFQAGDAYRRPHEGTGLGLSVVKGLVGLHHGTLSIESGQGAGTTVSVSLPLDCRQNARPTKPASVRTLLRPPRPATHRMSA